MKINLNKISTLIGPIGKIIKESSSAFDVEITVDISGTIRLSIKALAAKEMVE